jgi:uncharacterized protein YijF (DUF1287 family)
MNSVALTADEVRRARQLGLIKDADLSTADCARILGISAKVIRSAIRRGALRAIQWGPHCTRIARGDLLTWRLACERAAIGTKETTGTNGTTGTKPAGVD